MENNKKLHLFGFFILSFFLLELLFRIIMDAHNVSPIGQGLWISFLFSFSIGMVFLAVGSIFHSKLNFIVSAALLFLVGFFYSSQLVYHDFFRTFYTFYSAGNSAQVIDFWREILSGVWSSLFWIIIFFLPMILLILLRNGPFTFQKSNAKVIVSLFAVSLFLHGGGLVMIASGDKSQNTAYDLYFHNSSPVLSVEKLGLLTSMRVDLMRLLTDWSPVLKEPAFVTAPPDKPEELEKPPEELPGDIPAQYNMMEIDFETLIKEEKNNTIKKMHQYFSQVPPTRKNDYTGKFKGYNLILITAEGFSPYGVDKEITPTLHKLVHEGYQFTDFYVPLWDVSTSDGEYVALNGLIPKAGVWSFSKSGNNHVPFVMGNQLGNLGYKTVAYHNHTYSYYDRHVSHPNMGYSYKGIGNGLDIKETWPSSDLEMMEKTTGDYMKDEPFHAYYMTVSGHLEYNFGGNQMAYKNKEYVSHLNHSEQAKAYMATQIELDRAMKYLLSQLEKEGVADNTLIALSADHYPYGLDYKTIDEFEGKEVERNFDLYKSNLIIYAKGMEETVITKPVSSLDILPTLSNLLGLEYDSRLLMGTDIFSDSDPLVIFRNKSFITDKGRYNAETKKFTPSAGADVSQSYLDRMISIVNQKFYYSAQILENDYYRVVFRDQP
ncbi:MAG: LTA synthase family protein [Bacillota bacterium]